MPRLYRPHIPYRTRCQVALRQLGEMWPEEFLKEYEGAQGQKGKGWGALLAQLLFQLSGLLGAERLHLDHDPPLGARQRAPLRGKVPRGHRDFNSFGVAMRYEPDANDPAHLIYREKHAHHIKTNVRGEHGQHPDRVLIKRHRRATSESGAKARRPKRKWPKRKRAWPKRPFPSQKATKTVRRRRGRSARRVRHRQRHHESARA